MITTTTTSTVGLVAAYDSWLRSTTTTRNFKLLKMNRTDRLNRTEQIDWLTTSLASYSPSTSGNVDSSISSDSKFVAIHTAVQYSRDQYYLAINGKDTVSWIKVALLVRDGSPTQLRDTLYYNERRIGTRPVNIVEAYKGIYLILQQVLSSKHITLFGKAFIALQTMEATNHILQCLLDAGRIVLTEETNPTDRTALIRSIMSGSVVESYNERVKKGKEMAWEIVAYLKEQLVETNMKYLPRGHEEDVLDLVMETYRLEAGFFGKSPIYMYLGRWKKRRDASAASAVRLANDATREVAPTKAVPKSNRDIRFNEIRQRNLVTVVSTLDAPGLCHAVHEMYPLLVDDIQYNESLSFDNMLFRIGVSKLGNLGQHHALARFSRDPTKNNECLMPPKYLEQIKSTIAEHLASVALTKQPLIGQTMSNGGKKQLVSKKQPSSVSAKQLIIDIIEEPSSTVRPSGLPSRRAAQNKVSYSEVHIDNDGNDMSLSNGGKKRKASAIVSKSAIVSTSTKRKASVIVSSSTKQPLKSIESTKQSSKSLTKSTKQLVLAKQPLKSANKH